MNITALTKALKFACFPTLSLLLLLFFAFFSISKTIAFISSDDVVAVLLRISAFIAEVVLVGVYYQKYSTESIINNKGGYYNKRVKDGYTDIGNLKNTWNKSDEYLIYDTDDPNIVCIQKN